MVTYNYHIFKIKIYFFLVRVLKAKGGKEKGFVLIGFSQRFSRNV